MVTPPRLYPVPSDMPARVAVLETQVPALAEMLRDHRDHNAAVVERLDSIDRRLSQWYGIAWGIGLTVSAVWSVLLGAVAWMR